MVWVLVARLSEHLRPVEDARHEHDPVGAEHDLEDRRSLVGVGERQRAAGPAQVGVEVAEQRPGAAAGQQAGPVRDVGLEHRADPVPVRRDEPVVALAELAAISASDSAAARPAPARFPATGGPPTRGAGSPGPPRRAWRAAGPARPGTPASSPRRRDQEFRVGGQAVDDERPQPGKPQRPPAELSVRPPRPGRVHCGRVPAAQQLDGAHRLAQRRDREPGRGRSATSSSSTSSMVLTLPGSAPTREDLAPG